MQRKAFPTAKRSMVSDVFIFFLFRNQALLGKTISQLAHIVGKALNHQLGLCLVHS